MTNASRLIPWTVGLSAALLLLVGLHAADTPREDFSLEWQLPNEALKQPFEQEVPILFLSRNQNPAEWEKLPGFWNATTEKTVNPKTGTPVERKAVRIKVPLGLTAPPPVPVENPMTLAKWKLGKKIYYDGVLCSDGSVSCASCHNPTKGFTDQSPVSTGINNLKGGMSAPTVINSAYNLAQFWDGRAASLEDQAQGPPQNPVEMFDGEGHAWNKVVQRMRADAEYVAAFRAVFGTEPTRDAAAKAIATYERTVLSGNSLHDRADIAMRERVEEAGLANFTIQAKDYETVLNDAIAKKDAPAITALGFDLNKPIDTKAVAKSLANGRDLFFNKARCSTCHVGDNFTDGQFHNLGVDAKDGRLSAGAAGRFAQLPTGHKNPELYGAFKTPTLRGLVDTAPYLHNGSEATLEKVVEFYDRGGNVNEFLSPKMRDIPAEQAYERARAEGKPLPADVMTFGPSRKPIIPLKLKLTDQEKKDLVLFLRALQGDPIDPMVAEPSKMP